MRHGVTIKHARGANNPDRANAVLLALGNLQRALTARAEQIPDRPARVVAGAGIVSIPHRHAARDFDLPEPRLKHGPVKLNGRRVARHLHTPHPRSFEIERGQKRRATRATIKAVICHPAGRFGNCRLRRRCQSGFYPTFTHRSANAVFWCRAKRQPDT